MPTFTVNGGGLLVRGPMCSPETAEVIFVLSLFIMVLFVHKMLHLKSQLFLYLKEPSVGKHFK